MNELLIQKKINKPTRDDHNYIMRQIVMNYAFRVIRIVLIIFSISYFIGTAFYIFTWLSDDGVSVNTNFFGRYGFRGLMERNEDMTR